ncbi:hypothetical protein JO83_11260 [Avibacterium paragallinarum]|nr:hypothetical protein JO83_11260 [Avibacterium paragallinarum]
MSFSVNFTIRFQKKLAFFPALYAYFAKMERFCKKISESAVELALIFNLFFWQRQRFFNG